MTWIFDKGDEEYLTEVLKEIIEESKNNQRLTKCIWPIINTGIIEKSKIKPYINELLKYWHNQGLRKNTTWIYELENFCYLLGVWIFDETDREGTINEFIENQKKSWYYYPFVIIPALLKVWIYGKDNKEEIKSIIEREISEGITQWSSFRELLWESIKIFDKSDKDFIKWLINKSLEKAEKNYTFLYYVTPLLLNYSIFDEFDKDYMESLLEFSFNENQELSEIYEIYVIPAILKTWIISENKILTTLSWDEEIWDKNKPENYTQRHEDKIRNLQTYEMLKS